MSTLNIDGTLYDIPGIVIDTEAPDEQLIDTAIAARLSAEKTEEHASPNRWLEADTYAELKARGIKQVEIAKRCDVSESTVSKFIACSRNFSTESSRPSFWTAFREANSEARSNDSTPDDTPARPWTDDELALKEQLEDGDTIVVTLRDGIHDNLIAWATDNDRYIRIDRRTEWGNPFELPADGDRDTVIRNYSDHYLPHKPSLINRIGELQGKALGCWCYPDPCHGDVLRQEADG